MMNATYRVLLILIAMLFLMAGVPVCAAANETDDRIQSSAKQSYVFMKYLEDDAIKIDSKDGVVTLTGTVTEEPHKVLAQETVASLPGVKSVENRLQLVGEPEAGSADALVKARVKLDLLSHRNLSASKTDVKVKDGMVTLRGEATSKAQIDLTTEYIQDVEGVKDVKNDMTVSAESGTSREKSMGEKAGDMGSEIGSAASRAGKEIGSTAGDAGKWIGKTAGDAGGWIDDASITALVNATLLYHRSTSALHTKVETNGGQVRLSGMAGSAAEKDLVTKYVQDVFGVKSVVNGMTIQETKAN